MLTRPTGEILAANPQACAVFAAAEDALCKRSREGHRLLADAADPRLADLLTQRLATGHASGELRLRRYTGEFFEAEVSSFLFRDDLGVATSVLCVRDISALRAAQRAAVLSERRLDFALDAAGIGDWDMDLVTNVARRSLRHDQCFGYDRPVAVWGYDTFLSHVHSADRERVDAHYQAAMHGSGDYDVEFRVLWPDGTLHWLWSKGSFYFDEHGKATRVAGIQVDVTERRTVDEALRRSEERLQLAMRGSSDAIWDLNLVTNAYYYSDRWLEILGYDSRPDAHDRKYWAQQRHPDDAERVRQTYREALQSDIQTYEVEFRVRHRDGHYVPILSRSFILRDATGKAIRISGTNTDLTQRYELEEAHRRRAVAESASQAKTEFLSRMSHELRTPLNAVVGFAQLLSVNRADPLTAGQRAQVDHIERGGWHLLNLIDEILDLARIDSGQARIKLEPVPVAGLVDECVHMLQGAARERAVRILVQHGAGLDLVTTDRTRLRQILLNLIGNAVKYTVEGDEIVVAAAMDEGGAVILSVTDHGPGMSPEQQAQLFQPFNRLGQEHGRTPGNGIGLVISKRLAELLGGDITVTSETGRGSVFMLRLTPSARAEPQPIGLMADASTISVDLAAALPRGRVVCIEDNLVNAELMRQIFRVRPSLSLQIERLGRSGVAAVRQSRPDLVLLDLRLPDLPGLEVLRLLKQDPATASIPVVVVSASALAVDVNAAKDAGAADYVAKPVNMIGFLAIVDRILLDADHGTAQRSPSANARL